MARLYENWVSEELVDALEALTAQQATGVLRIVQAELQGRGISSLLDCEDQICTSTTYYNRKRGWAHKAEFMQALALARRDYRAWMLEWGGRDALAILAQTAPDGARVLRQQVVGSADAIEALVRVLREGGDQERLQAAVSLGVSGLLAVAPALISALEQEEVPEVRQALIAALGHVAAGRDSERRAAVNAVLSRVGLEEALRVRQSEGDVDAAIDAELARLREEAAGGA